MAEIIAEKIPQKPDEKFLGAFSDTRREGYKYAPEEIPGWQTTPTIEAPIAPRPWQPKDKNKFEQEVFKQIGVNPIQIDPVKELQKIESQLPGLFNQFFKGRVIWQDRNKLSKKQADDWSDFVKSARARVFDIVASFKQQKTDEYNWLMDRFKRDEDISKEAHDAKMKQYIDKKSDWEKRTKAPGTPKFKNVWDKQTQQYVQRSDEQIIKDPDRYEMKKAGALTIIEKVDTAVAKEKAITLQAPGVLRTKAIKIIDKRINEDMTLFKQVRKDPSIREKLYVEEMRKQAGTAVPDNAMFGQDPQGKWVWVVREGNRYRVVIDQSGWRE